MTFGIFKGVSSRSKLELQYREYDGLYRTGRMRTDQVTPALIRRTHHRRTRRKAIEIDE